MEYDVITDLLFYKKITGITESELASRLNISRSTLNRWITGESEVSYTNVNKIYELIYHDDIELNKIKSMLYLEDLSRDSNLVLFHGSKSGIEGEIDLMHTKKTNDFGHGFYCAQSFEQASMFASNFENASIYIVQFDTKDYKSMKFDTDLDWMLTIAYYRGRLKEYENTKKIKELIERVNSVDYVIAPIADNKMFAIIDSFVEGLMTDVQCQSTLSLTNIGYQYVLISKKAIDGLKLVTRCYLTKDEKAKYLSSREESIKSSSAKVKEAIRKHAKSGKYIEDILQ